MLLINLVFTCLQLYHLPALCIVTVFVARHSIKRGKEQFICLMHLNCHINKDVLLQSFKMVIFILIVAPITLLIALTLLATQPLPLVLIINR